MDYVKAKLAKFKWLERGVRFVDSIPKSANGKILNRIFNDRVGQEISPTPFNLWVLELYNSIPEDTD